MASFIARMIDTYDPDALDPEGDPAWFTDVPEQGYAHATAIFRLAGADVLQGTAASDGREFAPQDTVTRAQMASFIRRAISFIDLGPELDSQPPPVGDLFPDVSSGPHLANVNALGGAGIVQGTTDGTYRPSDTVTRDQTTAFLMRAYDLVVAEEFGNDRRSLEVVPDLFDESLALDVGEETETWRLDGLSDDAIYRITLVDATNIDVADEVVRFATTTDDGVRIADAGPPASVVGQVNGEPFEAGTDEPGHTVGDVVPEGDGSLTFTIVGDLEGDASVESLRPVVYVDEGASTFLEVDRNGNPIEAYGVGALLDVR